MPNTETVLEKLRRLAAEWETARMGDEMDAADWAITVAPHLPALIAAAEAAQLKRNHILVDEANMVGRWVAVPEIDFDALRAALRSVDKGPQKGNEDGVTAVTSDGQPE